MSPPSPEPTPPEAPPPPARGKYSRRRIAVAAGFIIVAIATAVVLIALALTQEAPRWWVTIDRADPAAIELARSVENGVTTALTKVRPEAPAATGPQPWKVFITTDQANAWLAARLRGWLADRSNEGGGGGGVSKDFIWPPEIDQVVVHFEDGIINIGARVQRKTASGQPMPGEKPQTIAAALKPEFKSDGSLWFAARSIQIGRLGLPASWVIGSPASARKRVGEVSGDLAKLDQTQRVLAALKGERPVVSRAVMKLADGRRVRILAIEPVDGRVVITCQTEQREIKAAR